MNQKFVRHPTIKNYETSRDGIVRHFKRKQPVGDVNNSGYLKFRAGRGGKSYYCHSFIYEVYNEEILKGLEIDYIDRDKCNNNINNLQVVTQSKNCSLGNSGKCKTVTRRAVKSINEITGTERIFRSMTSAGKYFGMCPPSVQNVADGIRKSALSKRFNQRIIFSYSVPDTKDTLSSYLFS